MYDAGHGKPMGGGRGALIMKVMEARKATPMQEMEDDDEDAEGGALSGMKMHLQKGLGMAKEYLGANDTNPGMRSKVEALMAAYEDLLSSLTEGSAEV